MELGNYHLATSKDNKNDEKEDIYLVSKILSTRYLIVTKRKLVTLSGETWQALP